jgi:hypothetical protein
METWLWLFKFQTFRRDLLYYIKICGRKDEYCLYSSDTKFVFVVLSRSEANISFGLNCPFLWMLQQKPDCNVSLHCPTGTQNTSVRLHQNIRLFSITSLEFNNLETFKGRPYVLHPHSLLEVTWVCIPVWRGHSPATKQTVTFIL